jgi:hypothetical protein
VLPEPVEALAHPRAEGAGLVQLRQAAVVEHVVDGLVHGEQRDRHADPLRQLHQGLEVRLVLAVGAVLVLDLDQHDRAAAVDLPRHQDRGEVLVVLLDRREVRRLAAADPGARLLEQPRGQAAVVPLGADVRSRAHDRVHAVLGDGVEEPAEVEPAARVELAAARAVRVPGHVGLDRVQAHLLGLRDPVGPQVRVDAEVVQRAGEDPHRLVVQQEVVFADREPAGGGAHAGVPRVLSAARTRRARRAGRPGSSGRPARC